MNKPYIDHVIIVEGSSDKAKVLSMFDARVLITNGYDIDEGLIKLLGKDNKLLVLTDDDNAGKTIRERINSIVPSINVEVNVKDCDKHHKHGVAECDSKVLFELLKTYVTSKIEGKEITNLDLYNLGINSKRQRDNICNKLSINRYSQKQLLEIINIIGLDLKTIKEYADQ